MIFLLFSLELSNAHILRLAEQVSAYEQKAFDTTEAFKKLALAFEKAQEATLWEYKEALSSGCPQEHTRETAALPKEPQKINLCSASRIRRFLFYGSQIKGHGCIPCKLAILFYLFSCFGLSGGWQRLH